MEEFRELVEEALATRKVLVAFVHCEITYSGRAETVLGRGDRLLVIKSDGAVLIHQPDGTMPVNYMKAGTNIRLERAGDHLVLNAHNQKEKAWLEVEIYKVSHAAGERLEDGRQLQLEGNERDMSDWIRDNPSCIGDDFRPIAREEQTDVGFIDVYGHDGNGGIIVVECKRITAGLQAVDQLRRYVERVKTIKGADVKGILAAPAITPNAKEMLSSWGFTFCAIHPPKRLERWQKDQTSLGEF